MKLVDLEPQFIRYDRRWGEPDSTFIEAGWRVTYHHVDSLVEAQGIVFLCPKCFSANGGSVGTHAVICWSRSRGTTEDAQPGPGRWTLDGTGFDDLTLNGDAINGGGARSVLLQGGCGWHGFVTKGEVT